MRKGRSLKAYLLSLLVYYHLWLLLVAAAAAAAEIQWHDDHDNDQIKEISSSPLLLRRQQFFSPQVTNEIEEEDEQEESSSVAREKRDGKRQLSSSVSMSLNVPMPFVEVVGNNGDFSAPYPLARCLGDCDTDQDCSGSLICMDHEPYEDVNGCLGGNLTAFDGDYCVQPPPPRQSGTQLTVLTGSPPGTTSLSINVVPNVDRVGNNGDFDALYPLARCQGDCDTDLDCSGTLICMDHKPNEEVPGCGGGQEDTSNSDFCILQPITPNGTELAVFLGSPPDRPLGHCEGDCDRDSDCQNGLVCIQRESFQQVNGCYFFNSSAAMKLKDALDLCVYKRFTERPSASPSDAPSATPSFSPTSLPSSSPSGSPSISQSPTNYPTKAPTPWPTPDQSRPPPALAKYVGNPGSNLRRCEGDCDSDNDCRGDLMCYDRLYRDENIPGCYLNRTEGGMSINNSVDVCIDPKSLGSKHRLRLYWELGYEWQELTTEEFFCLASLTSTDEVVVNYCSDSREQIFQFIYLSSGEALIRSDDGRCLKGRRLRACNAYDPDQLWFPYNGRWRDTKLELSRLAEDSECLSPHHHPRNGEIVYMLDCKEERKYTSNAWELY